MSTSDKVRVGAVGAGWWATTNHFPLLAADDRVDLVGVSSLGVDHLAAVQEQFGFRHATEDFEELLGWNLDALVVASPHHLHYSQTAAGLDRGLTVLCEKPMTLHAIEAWDLVERAEANSAGLVISLGWNYKPFLIRAKALMSDPGVGDIEYVSVRMASPTKAFFSAPAPTVPSDFSATLTGPDPKTWQDPARGGGYAHGQLSHAAGLLFWLTELRASRVTARSSAPHSGVDMYDAALIDFASGAHGILSGAATLPDDDKFQLGLEIFGSDGVLIVDVERERAELRRHDGNTHLVDIAPNEGAYSCEGPVNALVEIAMNPDHSNNSTGDTGARGVELLEALQVSASAAELKPVDINLTLGARH
ncbi:MAG: Gfo/Idh/MocA family oxidoreductase [Acidobacteria bacterium]|nr:Gfo/Idh/MocA family oxidoreductase [Acidobacteriota bacterium]